MECSDVYIAHIAAETFTCGTIPVMVTRPGLGEAQEVLLPTIGLKQPRVLLFSVLSCMEILGIETEMKVSGVWFAIDSVPPQFIEHRDTRGVRLDWTERDGRWARPGAGQPWEEWGEEGEARFGVDGVEIVEDRTPPDGDRLLTYEDMPLPNYPRELPVPVDEGERSAPRSSSSFVDDETLDNRGSASMLAEETPDITRSPEIREGGDENEEQGSTWMTELGYLINDELGIVTGNASCAPKSPSLGYPSPKEGLFIYDSCEGMW